MALAINSLNQSFMNAVQLHDFDQAKKDLQAGADVNVLKESQLIYSETFVLLLSSEYRMLTLLVSHGFNIADALPKHSPSCAPADHPADEWLLNKWQRNMPLLYERVTAVTTLVEETTLNPRRIQKLTVALLCMSKELITLINEYACEIPWEDREVSDHRKLRHCIGAMLTHGNTFIDKETGKERTPLPQKGAGIDRILWHIYDYYSA